MDHLKKGDPRIPQEAPEAFINREMSWLCFARRVLNLAEDPEAPLLERVKFAGIMGMIYDEFAMKRLGGLRRLMQKKKHRLSPDGLKPLEELQLCRRELTRQRGILADLVQHQLRPALKAEGIPILDHKDLSTSQKDELNHYFKDSVQPILSPLAVDIGHPFPFISSLALNLAITIHRPDLNQPLFIRLKVPTNRPRWVPVSEGGFVPLEQIMEAHLKQLFPRSSRIECHLFRVIRGAKDDPWDRYPGEQEEEPSYEPGSLIDMVSYELTARRFAGVIRLQVSQGMPQELKLWICRQLEADPEDIHVIKGLLSLTDLARFQVEGRSDLQDPPHVPVIHPRLRNLELEDPDSLFAEIRKADLLLHHPYHDYETSILRFLESAVLDPKVLALKLTIYRTSSRSPIIQILKEAAMAGKQVVVLVEITARFDEAPNIAWGEELEKAGVHVVYGVKRLKTHVKLGLVIREEEDGLRRYVHLSTGNYHTGTAKLYQDLGILTCNAELGEGVSAVFNELSSALPAEEYGPLLVAPHNLRQRFTQLIRIEAENAKNGKPSGIRAKMNQLQDPQIIHELYQASQAGVPILLNVRGLCCLKPRIPNLSPTIRVYSTLGRFLEHGRIFRFENAGDPLFFIGSADWMRRNLDKRMETITPVFDEGVKQELEEILKIYEADNCTAWDLYEDGHYERREPDVDEDKRCAQETFIRLAAEL